MHTTEWEDERGMITFHHNGDYSGDVRIIFNKEDFPVEFLERTWTNEATKGAIEIQLPFDALKDLVGKYVRSKVISELEDMTADELFDRL